MIWSLWLKNKDGIAVIEPGHTWTVSEITAAAERLEVTGPVVPKLPLATVGPDWFTVSVNVTPAGMLAGAVLPLEPNKNIPMSTLLTGAAAVTFAEFAYVSVNPPKTH